MKKNICECEYCGSSEDLDVCDTCGKAYPIPDIKLVLVSTEYLFCSNKCLKSFVDKQQKIEKDDRFEYGKDKK